MEKHFPKKKFLRFRKMLEEKGFLALVIAALLPPPLPFTPFVAAASLAKMPLRKLLGAVAVGRVLRFLAEGVLAILFGRHILRLLESDAFKVGMFSLFLLAIVGSIITLMRWLNKATRPHPAARTRAQRKVATDESGAVR